MVIAGYRIVAFLGQGFLSAVYEVEDLITGRHCALKTLDQGLVRDPTAFALLRHELGLASRVSHPNVCQIYDFPPSTREAKPGDPGESIVFLTLELLRGETLADRIRRRQRLPPEEVLPILTQAAAGLTAAHQALVIHGNFHPGNIKLVGDRAVIINLGLGQLAFGPHFKAPEQVEGGEITAASDIYAFGLVIYMAVTGRLPFEGATGQPPPSPIQFAPRLPQHWEETILRCLAPNPGDRFPTAVEVVTALSTPDSRPAFGGVNIGGDLRLGQSGAAGEVSSLLRRGPGQSLQHKLDRIGREPSMEADLSGRVIGEYEIQQRVGSGALGTVYRAVKTPSGQSVAINQVRHELVSNPKLWKSLQQQVELVSQLRHPAIAAVGGLIEDSGAALLVTEWIGGDSLEFYLLSHGALTPTSATELMRPICGAFVYAHSCGICHGWLHAANILITPAGPKLTNFGLERRVEILYGKRAGLAASRAIFMPPEWRRGERLDQAGDIYMLGALLFQMLTGKQRPALPAADGEHLPAIDELLPQFRQYVPVEFASLLRRAMAPDPKQRHSSVKEFESGMLAAVRVQISESTATFLPSELGNIAEAARVLDAKPQRAPSIAFKRHFLWFAAAVCVGMLGFIAFQQGRADKRRGAVDNAQPSAPPSNSAPSDVSRGVVPARQQWPSFKSSPRIAVIAGIDSYLPSSGFRNLSYASQDAEALYDELKRQGYTAHLLRNAEVMRHTLRSELRDAIAATDARESTLLFFFAGHGGESGGKQYLATYECAADSLDELCMPLKEVQDLMAGASAPRKMMFIDACRNDPGAPGKRANSVNRFSYLAASRGLRILNSTAPGQVSYEEPELKHGVFTYFLLEGIRGKAADGDGLITFNGLSTYTRKMMSDYTYAHNKFQVPYDSGEGSGDFLLAGALK